MVFSNNLLMGAAAAQGSSYPIDQSIRFNSAEDAYMHRTPSSAGNLQIWTYSVWFKRSILSSVQTLFNSGASEDLAINAANQLIFNMGTCNYISTQLFRDTSAWYHLIVAVDTTNATAASRVRFYLNGVEITSFGTETNPAENLTVNSAVRHTIGANEGNTEEWDGYIADAHLVDGAARAATSFGKFDTNGVWVPRNYSGSYGTNGFQIQGATASALGDDTSGNGNDYTTSGHITADQMLDSPVDDVDNGVGNYPTFSPLYRGADADTAPVLSNGNLTMTLAGAVSGTRGSTMPIPTTGKWYFEITINAAGSDHRKFGIITTDSDCLFDTTENPPGYEAGDFALNMPNGNKNNNNGTASYGSAATGGIVRMAVDMDNGKIWWGDGDAWYASGNPATGANAAFTSLAAVEYYVVVSLNRDAIITVNFGQLSGDFEYTPPTGFKALCTANLPAPAIVDPSAHFQTTLYTGNGTAIGSGGLAVNQSGNSTFQPDFVWIKNRDADDSHMLFDAPRTATKYLESDSTDAEATDTESLTSFDADGFTVGSNVAVNTNTEDYAAWQWLMGGGAGSSNTEGSINTTAGMSVSTYTGTGSNATIGHGLDQTPEMVMCKLRSGVNQWPVYHVGLTNQGTGYLDLQSDDLERTEATMWNSAIPTTTLIKLGSHASNNTSSGTHVAYAFHSVAGFSKFGSFEGNGFDDGMFVPLGFRPAFIMTKSVDSTSSWQMYDNQREGYNVDNDALVAEHTTVEATADNIDLLSNGFKMRIATDPNVAETYIYAAFAEHPFGGSGVSQARAR